jgi:hypothetical protein
MKRFRRKNTKGYDEVDSRVARLSDYGQFALACYMKSPLSTLRSQRKFFDFALRSLCPLW